MLPERRHQRRLAVGPGGTDRVPGVSSDGGCRRRRDHLPCGIHHHLGPAGTASWPHRWGRAALIALLAICGFVAAQPPGGAVYYEIFVRSFQDSDGDGIGDLRGVIDRLDYLDDLGIDGLWLMPIHPSGSYHGYDVTDYFAVHPDYGTLDDFRVLSDDDAVTVAAQDADPGSLLNHYRALIALRRASPALRGGVLEVLDSPDAGVLAFRRSAGADEVVVLANFTTREHSLELDRYGLVAARDRLGGADHGGAVTLGPLQLLVLSPRRAGILDR